MLEFTREVGTAGRIEDYGAIVLEKLALDRNRALGLVDAIATNQGKLPEADLYCNFKTKWEEPGWFRPSHLPAPLGGPRFRGGPARIFMLNAETGSAPDPYGPIVKPGLAPLVEPREGINEFLGFSWQHTSINNGLLILVSDERVAIQLVHFREQRVEVEVRVNQSLVDGKDLEYQAAVANGDRVQAVDVVQQQERLVVELAQAFTRFTFFALHKPTGEVLDWADIWPTRADQPPEVRFSSPGQQITQLIEGGENQQVEFKQEGGDGFTVIQSVVAFANQDGGTIIIGVTDKDGTVVGCNALAEMSRIKEWVERKCDPPVALSFDPISVGAHTLLVVRVPGGTNRPYQHRDNGVVYVRRGATDRPARRAEIDAFYRR